MSKLAIALALLADELDADADQASARADASTSETFDRWDEGSSAAYKLAASRIRDILAADLEERHA